MSAPPEELPPPALRTSETHQLTASDDLPLRFDLYRPDNDGAAGRGVILCHGFRGFKDWGFLPFLASRLADEGFPVAVLNFASSGVTDREGTFGEPERFRRGTYAGDLEDLARVAAWMSERAERGDEFRLGVAGHSRGGVISLLHAARDRRVGAIATLGSPAHIGVWPESHWEAWRRGEPADVYDFRTKQTLRLGPEIYRDWSENGARYDTAAAAASLTAPLLVVHGTRDALVPLDEARELASFGRSTGVELRVVEGAGHSFQAGDRLRRTPPPLLDAVESVVAWMRRWLQPNEIGDYFFSAGGGT